MREWLNIMNEGFAQEDNFTQSLLLKGIYAYVKKEIDPELTWAELKDKVRELKSHLRYPITIYRALHFPNLGEMDEWYDAHHSSDCSDELATQISKAVNFKEVGTSWTWDRACAVEGGSLSGSLADTHAVLEAKVSSKNVDLLVTLWMNLTSYEEEKEVRLFPNSSIMLTGMTPSNVPLKFPLRANTGPESWDKRDTIFQELSRYI